MTTTAEPRTSAVIGPPATGRPSRRRVKQRLGYLAITVGTLVALLVAWEIAARRADPILVATPTDVARTFVDMVADGTLIEAMAETGQPLLLGYLIAIAVGVPLGLLIGRFRAFDAALGWFVVVGYSMPIIALTPVFLLWFGLGSTVKVVMVATMTVFAIAINTKGGVQNVPRSLVEVGIAFGASRWRVLARVIFPSVIPSIMTGLRIGVGKAVIGVVVAEFFTAVGGLGGVIVNARSTFQPARMFAAVVVLSVCAVALTWLIGVLERRIAPWNTSTTAGGER